jgi:hypothetical protein
LKLSFNIDSYKYLCSSKFLNEYKNIQPLEEMFQYFEHFESMNPAQISSNLRYFSYCYIIHFKIIDLIKLIYLSTELINPHKIIAKNNNIYLLFDNKILIGNLNNSLLFETQYVINYNSKEILNNEKEFIGSMPFKDYLEKNNCDQNSNALQNLTENGIKKGKFLKIYNNLNDFFFLSQINIEKDSSSLNKNKNIKKHKRINTSLSSNNRTFQKNKHTSILYPDEKSKEKSKEKNKEKNKENKDNNNKFVVFLKKGFNKKYIQYKMKIKHFINIIRFVSLYFKNRKENENKIIENNYEKEIQIKNNRINDLEKKLEK